MSSRARRQLGLVGDAIGQLESAGVHCWLDGGWALDFRLGRISREHDDIDLIAFSTDREIAERTLSAADYEPLLTAHPEEHQHFRRQGERISLTFVEYDARGQLVVPGRWADWPYPVDALTTDPVCFEGVECRVLSLAAQLETKLNFSVHPSGAPLRVKDVVDVELLRDLIETESL